MAGACFNWAEGPLIEKVNTMSEKLGESPGVTSQTFSLCLVTRSFGWFVGWSKAGKSLQRLRSPSQPGLGVAPRTPSLRPRPLGPSPVLSSLSTGVCFYLYHELAQAAKGGVLRRALQSVIRGCAKDQGSSGRISRAVCDHLVTPLLLSS